MDSSLSKQPKLLMHRPACLLPGNVRLHLTEEKFQRQVGQALIDQYTEAGDLEQAALVVSKLFATRPTDAELVYLSYRLYSDLAGRSMLTLALTAPESAEMHQVMTRE